METILYNVIDICESNRIDQSFIDELQQNGLIEIVIAEDQTYLLEEQVLLVEKFAIWYYDLELNVQGIEVVQHLVQKISQLQEEVRLLKSNIL
ncbi:chaperone modulator CbpM [Sphingobacterium sp. HJSM2_6]|uniref:chaperone modulator CbpM n=1 Tax=Sphingobacterium sp. HJSM2_6 TaxID=3366264 RepID=UPI003BE39288